MAHADVNHPDRRVRWRARNAAKDRAHRMVENHIRQLKRRGLPLPVCQVEAPHECKGAIHAMHHDYERPLDVVWACASWHIKDHWEREWSLGRTVDGKRIVAKSRTIIIEEV